MARRCEGTNCRRPLDELGDHRALVIVASRFFLVTIGYLQMLLYVLWLQTFDFGAAARGDGAVPRAASRSGSGRAGTTCARTGAPSSCAALLSASVSFAASIWI